VTGRPPRGRRPDAARDVDTRLGAAVRARRHALGRTLVEVATAAGLSHPFLSQLERGLTRPSMRSLSAIAAALDTTAQALMAAAETLGTDAFVQADASPPDSTTAAAAASASVDGAVSVVRHDADALSVASPGGTVRTLVRGERGMLPVEYLGAPASFAEHYCHDGEEFVYVVTGRVEIEIDGVRWTIEAGDSVYYAGGLPHRWRSAGPDPVRLVVVQRN
jgi:transcriptional regulator with XRE-family HTH domain/quercetin dioxygenase-like cupin family protein